MSITNELRECATDWGRELIGSGGKAVLFNIADRIDAEYEKSMVDALLNDGLPMSDEVMAEHGWYRVLDADKQPIHIGDELDGYGYPKGGAYCKAIVNEVMILAGPKDSSYRSWLMWDATEVRHHHKPTVEDVLREFALEIDPSADIAVTGAETVKKFAAKLQLKEPNE